MKVEQRKSGKILEWRWNPSSSDVKIQTPAPTLPFHDTAVMGCRLLASRRLCPRWVASCHLPRSDPRSHPLPRAVPPSPWGAAQREGPRSVPDPMPCRRGRAAAALTPCPPCPRGSARRVAVTTATTTASLTRGSRCIQPSPLFSHLPTPPRSVRSKTQRCAADWRLSAARCATPPSPDGGSLATDDASTPPALSFALTTTTSFSSTVRRGAVAQTRHEEEGDVEPPPPRSRARPLPAIGRSSSPSGEWATMGGEGGRGEGRGRCCCCGDGDAASCRGGVARPCCCRFLCRCHCQGSKKKESTATAFAVTTPPARSPPTASTEEPIVPSRHGSGGGQCADAAMVAAPAAAAPASSPSHLWAAWSTCRVALGLEGDPDPGLNSDTPAVAAVAATDAHPAAAPFAIRGGRPCRPPTPSVRPGRPGTRDRSATPTPACPPAPHARHGDAAKLPPAALALHAMRGILAAPVRTELDGQALGPSLGRPTREVHGDGVGGPPSASHPLSSLPAESTGLPPWTCPRA